MGSLNKQEKATQVFYLPQFTPSEGFELAITLVSSNDR